MALSTLLRTVRGAWNRHPLIRDMTLFSSLFVGAELSQQTLLKKIWKIDPDPNYDYKIMARYAVFGVAVYPVLYYNWYRFLDRRFPGTALPMVAKKVMMDQFVLEPPLILLFYSGMSFMEGKDDLLAEFKAKFLPTFKFGCLFWMPAMAINFLFFPLAMRVTFVGVCTFIWCNVLCLLKRMNVDTGLEEEPSSIDSPHVPPVASYTAASNALQVTAT